MSETKRVFFNYDARAMADAGTDDALVLVCGGDTLEDAIKEAKLQGLDCAIYSYAYKEGDKELFDEQWEQDYYAKN